MAHVTYDRTLPSGLKLAEHVNAALALIDEAATLKQLASSMTRDGALKEMLEIGYAGKVVEVTLDQSAGSSPGNVSIGGTYTGDTSGAVGKVVWQNDQGSVAEMVLEKVSGTFQLDELVTGSNGNTAQIDVLDLTPGGGDAKYDGEIQFGAEAGAGAALYDGIVSAMDGLTALRNEFSDLFQGG